MAEIALAYERSETDELGIRLTASEMGVELGYIPFHKVAVTMSESGVQLRNASRNLVDDLQRVGVILNRTQSKNRRIYGASVFEALDKHVLNTFPIELACQSKVRTLLRFSKKGIKIPKTVFVPCNPVESTAGRGDLDYSRDIASLIFMELGSDSIVVKPDAGTHGSEVKLVSGPEGIREAVKEIRPSTINPVGALAQELVPKWFYDLRIIVEKKRGSSPFCHPTALARGGFMEFRTNTFLGNMVFRARLPQIVRDAAILCGEAIGNEADSWVLALDAMPWIGEANHIDEGAVQAGFEALKTPFSKVLRAKNDPSKKADFARYSRGVEEAYAGYMSTEPYAHIENTINESLEKTRNEVRFHECNACPEFWEQTRIVGGINVAESLLKCAGSLLDR